jgi:GT2 family glycosyltransferase
MVDIVIVNWNSGPLLNKCIHSIFNSNNEHYVNKIYIIDNHSADQSLAVVLPHQKLQIIQNATNLGFAKACNQGFKLCTAPYVLLLNPDARLLQNTLTDCINYLDENKQVDILGCQLLDDEGKVSPSCARFPTPFRLFVDAVGLSKVAPKLFRPAILMTEWNHLESRYVDQVMGAFMFMPTAIFKKAGYFDERFFVYFEELDFSLHIAKMGGKSYYNSEIKAVHTGMGTTEAVKAFRLFLNLRSRLQYAKKNFSFAGYVVVFISTFLIEFFTRLFFLAITGRFNEIKDLIKAYQLLISARPSETNTPVI